MTAEQKATWIEALRSGKYKQGHDYLKQATAEGIEYCCLGVAREVLGVPAAMEVGAESESETFLDGKFLSKSKQRILVVQNDVAGVTFADIADYIETFVPPTE